MSKFNRSAVVTSLVFVFVSLLVTDATAQKVKLRSKLTPNCGVNNNSKFADIHADGNIAVLGSYSCRGAFIFDVSDPDAPTLSNWYNPTRPGTSGTKEQFLEAIVVGNRGYFGSGNGGGVYIVDLTNPASPQLLGRVHSGSGNGHNSIHEMMIFEQNGATYLLENFNGFSSKILKVINITDPAAPVFVRDINPTEISWVHAYHIRGNRLYTSGWGTGSVRGRTEIYDIANIGTQAPTLLGFVEDPASPASNGNNMHSSWTSEDGNYLYSAREVTQSNGASPGDVRVYDVTNPATPLLVDRLTMAGLELNAVTPHNPVVMGNKLFVSWYQAGLQVFDISVPDKPRRTGQYDTFEPAFAGRDYTDSKAVQDEPWDIMCGGENLQNALPTVYDGAWAVFPFLGEDRVLIGDLTEGLLIVDTRGTDQILKNVVADFDADGKTDLSTFTPSTGLWTINNSGSNQISYGRSGLPGDIAVPGDYDGDGKSDVAIWRPSDRMWWIDYSGGGSAAFPFGLTGDVPVPDDYDADGFTDVAVWRPSTGVWYILRSTLGVQIAKWGIEGDKPITGDFDGDGKSDLTVFRPSTALWYTLQSSSTIPLYIRWGLAEDDPVRGDFNGDGRLDYSVFRPSQGIWYIMMSNDPTYTTYQYAQWGQSTDIPVPADYDGDGKTDFAFFRPSQNTWHWIGSQSSNFFLSSLGQTGDVPLPASVNP